MSRNYNSSDLIQRIQAKTIYADFLVQSERFQSGCSSRIQLTSGSGGTNQSSALINVDKGAVFTTVAEQAALIAENACPTTTATTTTPIIPTVVPLGLALYYNAGIAASYPGSGTTIFDLSTNGYNGTLTNGPTYSSANGGSLVFDGTNDYINTNQSLASESYTLQAWIKTSDISDYRMIFSKETTVGGPWNYRLYLDRFTGYLVTDVAKTGGSGQCVYNGVKLADGNWHFVCGSRNATTGQFKLYIDGALVKTQADGLSGSITNSQVLWIGRSAFSISTGYPWNGNIAATLLYTVALTDAEVLQNYNATKARFL